MGTSSARAFQVAGTTAKGTGGTPDLMLAQGSGKTPIARAYNSVIQVNPNGMANLYQQGAAQQQNFYMQGLNFYSQAVAQAGQEIQSGYGQAEATLAPLSQNGQIALNEQMKMLGLQPASLTSNYANRLNSLTPYAGSNYSALQSKMVEAEKLTDPTQRAAAKEEILKTLRIAMAQPQMDAIGNRRVETDAEQFQRTGLTGAAADAAMAATKKLVAEQEAKKAEILQQAITGPVDRAKQIADLGTRPSVPVQPVKSGTENQQDFDARMEGYKAAVAAQAAYDTKVQQINLQATGDQSKSTELQQLYNDFQQNYSIETPQPYTGAQVADRIAATPGYQFQLDQGTNAIARQRAATGQLASGGTGVALLEYGQQLAQNTYNGYMQNLTNISNMGAQATNAMANNQVNQGQNMANLATVLGGAVANTYQGIGNAINAANVNEAQMRQQVAQFNAQMQYNSKQANLNRQAAANMQGMSSAPGMISAATQAAQFGYGVYQGIGAANQFLNQPGQITGAWAGMPQPMSQEQANAYNRSV